MIKIMKYCPLVFILAMISCKNNRLEDGHPYDTNLPTSQPTGLLPGLTNLGGTCFANASINVLLWSNHIKNLLDNPLAQIPGEVKANYDLRIKLQTSLKVINDARQKKQKDLSSELNAYFDAFEAARKAILGDERVGNKDKLRQEQGDARDFVEDNLLLLGYGNDPQISFAYNVFTDDNSRKAFNLADVVLGLTISNLAKDKDHSLEDAYNEWLKPGLMAAPNQVQKTPGNLVDSNRFYLINEPASPSLFMATLRFVYDLTGKPAKKLTTVIKPSMELTINSRTKADLNTNYPHTYQLKAIAIHHGSLGGGHYYAYVYNYSQKRWEKYNDTQVSVVTEAEVLKDAGDGYIYLYEIKP